MSTTERVRTLVEPVVTGLGLEVFDVELTGGILRVTVDRPASEDQPSADQPSAGQPSADRQGLDLDAISDASRAISRLLDEHDPVPGRYTLEVTSPGLERRLRTPGHFVRAIGSEVSVKTTAEVDGERRFKGTLVAADDAGVTVRADDGEHRIAHDQIDRARTVFEWGPAPKPGGNRNHREKKRASAR
jgi:ribosome maturation factor RimP